MKTSLAPGSRVVTDYYERAGLMPYLEQLGFHLVGFGCTTCIGNSGPLPAEISRGGRPTTTWPCARCCRATATSRAASTPTCRMNYLASPPLVVAYALAGTMDIDLLSEPLGTDTDGAAGVPARHLADDGRGGRGRATAPSQSDMFRRATADVFDGDERWRGLPTPRRATASPGTPTSTYVRQPPYFDGMPAEPRAASPTSPAPGCLAVLGDSVTTDHISPAGVDQARQPGRPLPDRARRRRRRTSTPTAPAAATTR